MKDVKNVCSVCRKIKIANSFIYGTENICNDCWATMQANERIKIMKENKIKKEANINKEKRKQRRTPSPTTQVHILRVKGCKCPLSHLIKLFNAETKTNFIHLQECPLCNKEKWGIKN